MISKKNKGIQTNRRAGPQDRRTRILIGAKIRYQRHVAAMTQSQLGTAAFGLQAGPAQTRIKKFELSEGRPPSPSEIKQICDALGITVEDFETGSFILPRADHRSFLIDPKIIKIYPESSHYMQMINLAISNNNFKLVAKIVNNWLTKFKQKLT